MNILHIIDTTGPGGAETVFIELADRLQQLGHDSTVVIRGEGWVNDELKRRGLKPIILPCRGSFALDFLLSLRKLIRDHRIDLIQSHLLGSNVYAALAGLLTRTPVVATYHGMVDISPNERFMALKKWVMKLGVNRFVVVSQRLLDSVEQENLLQRSKTCVIYNGVDINSYNNQHEKEHDPATFRIGSLGNIRPAKAYDILLQTARLVVNDKPHVRFTIGGEGRKRSLFQQLDQQRKHLGLENHVEFQGFVANSAEFLEQLDLFLLTSSSEGFSIATIEAMACGLPVVATRCGGPEEIIDNDVDGLLVEAGNPEAIARAIISMIDDPESRKKIAASGRLKVEQQYSMKHMIDRYQNIYRELLEP